MSPLITTEYVRDMCEMFGRVTEVKVVKVRKHHGARECDEHHVQAGWPDRSPDSLSDTLHARCMIKYPVGLCLVAFAHYAEGARK